MESEIKKGSIRSKAKKKRTKKPSIPISKVVNKMGKGIRFKYDGSGDSPEKSILYIDGQKVTLNNVISINVNVTVGDVPKVILEFYAEDFYVDLRKALIERQQPYLDANLDSESEEGIKERSMVEAGRKKREEFETKISRDRSKVRDVVVDKYGNPSLESL